MKKNKRKVHARQPLKGKKLELILEHIDFARKLAWKFYRDRSYMGVELEDFEGAAFLGLCEAAQRYNCKKGLAFSTFSYYRIRGAMLDLLRYGAIVPKKFFGELLKSENASNEKLPFCFAWRPEDLSSLAAVIENAGIKIYQGIEGQCFEITYLDQKNPEEVLISKCENQSLQEMIGRLSEGERQVLELRHFEGCSLEEAQERIGNVSRSWVSRTYQRALQSLRDIAAVNVASETVH